MQAIDMALEAFDELTPAKQTCYILCGRNATEDCKKDMGLSCQSYEMTFEQMFEMHRIGDDDPDAWEPHEETIEDEDKKEDAEDSSCDECDEVIDIKLKSENSVSSVYADEDT